MGSGLDIRHSSGIFKVRACPLHTNFSISDILGFI